MTERLHLVLERSEKERYRRAAAARGQTLSQWLRDAAEQKLAAESQPPLLRTAADLEAFFAECDEREPVGREPDWGEQRQLIEESRRRGLPS